jgi:hypothetical protein
VYSVNDFGGVVLEQNVSSCGNDLKTESRELKVSRNIPAYSVVATLTPTLVHPNSRWKTDFQVVIFLLARLEDHDSDFLIMIQVPHMNGEYDIKEPDLKLETQTDLMKMGIEIASQIRETLEVKDWGLFGE